MNPILKKMLLNPQGLIKNGLVEYWDFIQGADAQVLYGKHFGINGQLGSTTGADSADPTWTAGGLSFGGDDYVSAPDQASLQGLSSLTAFVVYKTIATPNMVIFEKNGNSGFSIQQNATTYETKLAAGGVTSAIVTNAAFNDGQYRMFTFILSSTIRKVYVGNTDKTGATAAATPNTNTGVLYLGGRGAIAPFTGDIACAGLYNRTLNHEEIIRNHRYLKRELSKRGVTI